MLHNNKWMKENKSLYQAIKLDQECRRAMIIPRFHTFQQHFERSDFKGNLRLRSFAAFEITEISLDFFHFPSKSPKV